METRTNSESRVEIAELMLPEHANSIGLVHGGTIMKIIDTAAGIAAARHARMTAVTASVDRIDFIAPVYIGDLIIAKASLNYVSRTSMEVGVRVEAEKFTKGLVWHVASAYLTFVALDENRKPTEVPRLKPETAEEKRRFAEGKIRREKRVEELKKKRQKS
ncbi:MAG: acyl-CoA thioesterase [Promethearchaeota archaeon]